MTQSVLKIGWTLCYWWSWGIKGSSYSLLRISLFILLSGNTKKPTAMSRIEWHGFLLETVGHHAFSITWWIICRLGKFSGQNSTLIASKTRPKRPSSDHILPPHPWVFSAYEHDLLAPPKPPCVTIDLAQQQSINLCQARPEGHLLLFGML